MASLFDRFMGRKEPTSAEIAKERLKLVLVSDRSDLSPDKLEQMQNEIIEVIKRYIQVDEAQVLINVEQRARQNYLVADIPLMRDHSYGGAVEESSPASGAEAPEPAGDKAPDDPPASADTQPAKPGGKPESGGS